MCEWLSRGEWSDVRLVCGGRTFSAHRAVLASVSIFLRDVLLSCPEDDTQTFIVLPDFDLEAMSSVLYYIYHGEVTVDKHRLLLFLEVIKTLEIFIEPQYLSKLDDHTQYEHLNLQSSSNREWMGNIFTLSSGKGNEYDCVTLRKVEQDMQERNLSVSDCDDKDECCRSMSDVKPTLVNSQASHQDRQRNSLLRDLCIETYPRNGNVNGLAGRVLAISNECYRAPRSVFSSNANDSISSRAGDVPTETNVKRNDNTYLIPNLLRTSNMQKLQDTEIVSKNLYDSVIWESLDLSRRKVFIDNSYDFCFNHKNSLIDYQWSKKSNSLMENVHNSKLIHTSTTDLRFKQSSSVVPNTHDCRNTMNSLRSSSKSTNYNTSNDHSTSNSNLCKLQIFNQVIECPWRPRLPNNYKPFKRKETITLIDSASLRQKDEDVTVNDSNNNLEKIETAQCDLPDNVSAARNKEFESSISNQVRTSEDVLGAHMKRNNIAGRYSCGECGKTFSQLRNYKYHMSVHRGTREFAATCSVCGKYFNDRGYLSSHMKIHRNRKEYKCSQCPKSFNQRVAYNMHVRIHTGVKPHVCEECGKAFSRKMLLKQHQRTHSGERPYACSHCDKRFADRSNMTLHLRLHTGVKPFSCTLCPKSFTKKHHLKSHLNFHTGAKPYACPRCNLAFTQSSNMRTHLKKCSAPAEDILPA